jgi:hypothetical protein
MGSRGIKSAEEQALVVSGAIVPGQRPEVPTDLDEAEQKLWLQISRALPAEWFHTGDPGTLLKLYVRHAVYADVRQADSGDVADVNGQYQGVGAVADHDAGTWRADGQALSVSDQVEAHPLKPLPKRPYRADDPRHGLCAAVGRLG